MVEARDILSQAKRIVVKIGTAALSRPDGRLNYDQVAAVADQVARLRARGVEVVLVTSGAIGAGTGELDLPRRPSDLPQLQAAAAIGQVKLMSAYDACFRERGCRVAQVLLTREDFDDRVRYLNASHALHALLAFGAVPVINENDTVAVEEITFGDNDVLSALVATLVRADVLVLLSVVKGLYDRGRVVPLVEQVTDAVRRLDTGERSKGGSGGMESKLEAAAMLTSAGGAVVIASGLEPDVLTRLMAGEEVGTLFPPTPTAPVRGGRKLWIRFGGRPKGRIVVDEGARQALVRRGKSLLPSGVVQVEGEFARGDLVALVGPEGEEFARGLVNYSREEAGRIKGLRTSEIARILGERPYDELIHRDNLVLRAGP